MIEIIIYFPSTMFIKKLKLRCNKVTWTNPSDRSIEPVGYLQEQQQIWTEGCGETMNPAGNQWELELEALGSDGNESLAF